MDLAPVLFNRKNSEYTAESEQFDIRLTVNHLYLKSNELGELPAKSIYANPGCEISVPLFAMEAVLLPGQILPLYFTARICVDFVRKMAKKNQYFCLMTIDRKKIENQYLRSREMKLCSKIGTLFQVKNIGTDDDRLTIQTVGRQRCRLLQKLERSEVFYNDKILAIYAKVNVQVLEEFTLPSYFHLNNSTLNRLSTKKRHMFYSRMSHNDAFAIAQSSTEAVVSWLKNWFKKWFNVNRLNVIINQGNVVFSYWVASNLPVDLKKKLEFLEEMSSDRRLRMEWNIASQSNFLACSFCGEIKCEINDFINLSVEGNGMHFVNSNGYVHEMFTIKQLNNSWSVTEPTEEFSWFPGYAWSVLHCGGCSEHIGWQFTSSMFLPKMFYGITRRRLNFIRTEDDPMLL